MRTKEVYVIRNTNNDKVYIGQTVSGYEKRFRSHKNTAMSSNKTLGQCPKLYNAMRKYGPETFYIELVEACIPMEEIDDKETYYIKEYEAFTKGYNTLEYGETRKGYRHTEETLEKMRKSQKGRIISEEGKKKSRDGRRARDSRTIINLHNRKKYHNKYDLADLLGVSTTDVTKVARHSSRTLKGINYMFLDLYEKEKARKKRFKQISERIVKKVRTLKTREERAAEEAALLFYKDVDDIAKFIANNKVV